MYTLNARKRIESRPGQEPVCKASLSGWVHAVHVGQKIMAFTVIKNSDEPILLLRVVLPDLFAEDGLANLKAQVLRYQEQEDAPLYVIWDFIGQELGASDVQLLVYDAQEDPNGTVADPRLRALFVTDHPVLGILQRKVREQFGVTVWQFFSVDDALAWARAQVENGDT